MTYHLVHWINEGAWDVYDEKEAAQRIPEELRFEGALGMMTWKDGNSYLGKVKKISDKTTVEKEEKKLRSLIETEKRSLPQKRSQRKVKQSATTASERQVSKALGERPKLTPEQMEIKKAEQLKKKMIEEAQEKEEARQDQDLIRKSVSRNLIDKFDTKPADAEAMSDDDVALGGDVDEDNDGDTPMRDSVIAQSRDSNSSADESDMDEDYHKKDEIEEFKNPVTVSFLHFLLKKFGSPAAIKMSDDQQFAQPVTSEGQKMVRLVKGHSLKISKGGRNILEIDTRSKKNPSVFTRKTLTQLYGNNLDSITAMGRKKGSICISDEDKSAIYDFVVNQCDAKSFPWTTFIRCMTKKCSQAKSPKEKKVVPKSKEKKDSESKQKADKSDPKDQEQPLSPSKSDYISKLVAPTPAPEEASQLTVRASPRKFQKNLIVQQLNPEHTHQKAYTLLENSGNSTNQISSWQQQGSQNSEGFHGQSSGPQPQQSEGLRLPHGQAAGFQGQSPVFQGQVPVFHGQAPAPGFQGQPAGFQGQAVGWGQSQDQWANWYRNWPPQEAQANHHYNY